MIFLIPDDVKIWLGELLLKKGGSFIQWVGAAFISVNLFALWEPWDAVWWVWTVGACLLLIGGMVKGGANIVETDEISSKVEETG